MSLLIFLQFLLIPSSLAIIGYDCGSQGLNVTTVSLLNIGDCDLPNNEINVTKQYIQLLQTNDYVETPVIQCKIEITRQIFHCGHWSHNSLIHFGSVVRSVSRQTCELAHTAGVMNFGRGHIITGLKPNSTSTHSITFAGTIENDGACSGSGYSDEFGSWAKVVATGFVKITLQDYTATVSLDSNKLHLRSGTACALTDKHCIDFEGGSTYWQQINTDICKFHQYSILYQGYANKMVDNDADQSETIYSLSTDGTTFALAAKGRESVCGYVITLTEHPKLFNFETNPTESFASGSKISVSNLDIFAYVNSKFVYVEKHVRTQIKNLYKDILFQRCTHEKQTIMNSLSIATFMADEFAYNFMKGPGYMSVVAGEVVHIIKCLPVEVTVEHGDECYAELQVTRNNQTLFLTPKTHILKNKGTKTACNALLPSYYYVESSWYKIMPRPTEAVAPSIVKPLTKNTWKYFSPGDLANSGIYTKQDLKDLRERIMFPIERPAVLNDVAREISGQVVTADGGLLMKLFNEEAVSHLAESTWNKVWNKFMTFGTISAAFLSIMIIIQGLKTIVNIVIRGVTLHTIFGWSLHLLGALWSSVSYLLLHRHHNNNTTNDIEQASSTPLQDMDDEEPASKRFIDKPEATSRFLKG